MSDQELKRKARKEALDTAVREYVAQMAEDGAMDGGGYVTGWTMGISVMHAEALGEFDGFIIESMPGMNNFMARGLADATAESFQEKANGYGMEDD